MFKVLAKDRCLPFGQALVQNFGNFFAQAKCAGASIALCTGYFGKLLTRQAIRQLFRCLAYAVYAYATATPINYKVAAARGVRSILCVVAPKSELSCKFSVVSLNKMQ